MKNLEAIWVEYKMEVTIPDGTHPEDVRAAALDAIEAGNFQTLEGPSLQDSVEGVSEEWEVLSAPESEL